MSGGQAKRGRQYRTCVCIAATKRGRDACPVRSVAAAVVEGAVISQLRALLRSPEIVAMTWRAANRDEDGPPVSEREVVDALQSLEPVWDELFPGEQARVLRLLLGSVTVATDGLEIKLRAEGLSSFVEELCQQVEEEQRSAA